ncbi:SHOCT domain-containing protein [Kitasatospora sp. MAP5-34]|uniref:SHOCT domain-containing protein n=1 Tax=Kitasatospora sp. MAP5-34 TaxID=3035102 RepID=UPI00247331BB|nr:SHOCT domain-containing protein [Kitasatospora sp. MAP5-34]MDH6577801.1 putative membrane protein [Kitasatospora sp. MAP5-34]
MNLALANLASDYPLLNLFWTIAMIFLWVLWFMLLFRVIGDIFRDHELGGGGKAAWALLVVILPFLGVFVYLIARGTGMHEREVQRAQQSEEAFRTYLRAAAGTTGSTDELTRLAELKNRGDITAEEYERAKAKILA